MLFVQQCKSQENKDELQEALIDSQNTEGGRESRATNAEILLRIAPKKSNSKHRRGTASTVLNEDE